MAMGFSDQFQHWLVPDVGSVEEAMTTGLVVLDANVLLSAYRFAATAREELFVTIERLGDRVWVSHQAGLEFHRNRYDVISGHAAAYKPVLEALTTYRSTYAAEVDKKIREMCNRTGLPETERDRLLLLASSGLDPLIAAVESLRSSHGLSDSFTDDRILARIQAIVKGRIGQPLSGEDDAEARREAGRRIQKKIPPGYKDAAKTEPEGDYLVWLQTLHEVKRRSSKWLVFVSGDVKEDWILRSGGKTVGPQPLLAQELSTFAGARLLMMETQTFLHHASSYLKFSVSPETLQQAGRIVDSVSSDHPDPDTELVVLARRVADVQTAAARASRAAAEAREQAAVVSAERAQLEAYIQATGSGKGGEALLRNAEELAIATSKLRIAEAALGAAYARARDSEASLHMLEEELDTLRRRHNRLPRGADGSVIIG